MQAIGRIERRVEPMNRAHPKTTVQSKPPRAAATRLGWLDSWRGLAVLAMIGYHFCFDLSYLGWLKQDPYHDPGWQLARTLILGVFLLTVGASHALAEAQGSGPRRHWWRLARIALAAGLVTAASSLLFPHSIIWFGTLHAIAVMGLLLLLMPCQRWPGTPILLLAALMLYLGNTLQHPLFDQPALAWLGFMTHLPQTEDYVPLLPWFGVTLCAYVGMRQHLQRSPMHRPACQAGPRWLQACGRHSLAIYLLHQPVLLGILIPLSKLSNH